MHGTTSSDGRFYLAGGYNPKYKILKLKLFDLKYRKELTSKSFSMQFSNRKLSITPVVTFKITVESTSLSSALIQLYSVIDQPSKSDPESTVYRNREVSALYYFGEGEMREIGSIKLPTVDVGEDCFNDVILCANGILFNDGDKIEQIYVEYSF